MFVKKRLKRKNNARSSIIEGGDKIPSFFSLSVTVLKENDSLGDTIKVQLQSRPINLVGFVHS